MMFDGLCVVEKVRVGGGEINQCRDVYLRVKVGQATRY